MTAKRGGHEVRPDDAPGRTESRPGVTADLKARIAASRIARTSGEDARLAAGNNESAPVEATLTLAHSPGDGLSDAAGPIPAFGPARTDRYGRIVMGDDEWEARRAASARALEALGAVTDESDTDEVWGEVFRGLEGAR